MIQKSGTLEFAVLNSPMRVSFKLDVSSEDYSLPYGHRFERYLTLDKYGNQHNKYETLTTDECSKCVLRTTLSSGKETIKLFYSAEIDAIDRG